MRFEKFTQKGIRKRQPLVTIFSAGYIKLNSACMEKYFKGIKYMQLFYDYKDKIIGIRKATPKGQGIFKLTLGGNKKSGTVAGKSFLKYYNIDFGRARSFEPIWNEKNKMLLVFLNKELKK